MNNLLITLSLLSLLIFSSFGDKIFVGKSGTKQWYDAASACSSLTLTSGQLATWNNQDEYDIIAAITDRMNIKTWVGLSDIDNEGIWKFVDGDESYWLSIYIYTYKLLYFICNVYIFSGTDCDNLPQWTSGEPNNANTGEDVAEMYTNGNLNDQDQNDYNGYICEFNLPDTYVDTASSLPNYYPIIPNYDHGDRSTYYIFKVTSFQDLIKIFSILLNIILIILTCFFYYSSKKNKLLLLSYSNVKIYDNEEDEKL